MNVLIVDDRPESIYLLSEVMKSRGYQVVAAQNGKEALEKLPQHQFGLIVSDIMMPKMDGFQLCRAIKLNAATASIPFVFYSATYTDARDEAFALSLGASGFIVKPTEPDEFVQRIDEVLSKAAENKILPRQHPPLEDDFLRNYNERLVRKLEDKLAELEDKNNKLQQLTTTLEDRIKDAVKEVSEKNNDLESFVYSVSHDLRAPLRAIAGMVEILVEDLGPTLDAEKRGMLDLIVQRAGRMNSMIEGLLAYSRVSTAQLQLERVPLQPAIDEALQQLAARIKDTKASVEIPEELPAVLAQRTALVQVFANLFDNAFKFVAPGVIPKVQVHATRESGHVQIRIKDNGIGISQQDHARVFQVFEQLNSGEYLGTGVGLAIVRKAIDKMRGSIQLESEPTRGSTFILRLQAAA